VGPTAGFALGVGGKRKPLNGTRKSEVRGGAVLCACQARKREGAMIQWRRRDEW